MGHSKRALKFRVKEYRSFVSHSTLQLQPIGGLTTNFLTSKERLLSSNTLIIWTSQFFGALQIYNNHGSSVNDFKPPPLL